MERPTVEHDFFSLERAANVPRSSIRGFQSAIQRMNPVMVRSVMANPRPLPPPPPPPLPPAPALVRSPSMLTTMNDETAPLTIFYNGSVTVFHVGSAEAEAIMKLAAENYASKFTADLPMARKKSLLVFLEKRKERLTAIAPRPLEEGEFDGGSEKKKKKARMEL